MTVRRPMGMETEFGILRPGDPGADARAVSEAVVQAYATAGKGRGRSVRSVTWDYGGEDPLADSRGFRLERSAADPSQLTDDPHRRAPSGPADGAQNSTAGDGSASGDEPGVAPRPADFVERPRHEAVTGGRTERLDRPREHELLVQGIPNVVLTNGARLYVDHAHPEYSGPECMTPREVLRWDRAGDRVAERAMAILERTPGAAEVAIYKNNVDGKGASYGTHENFLLRRDVPFGDVVTHLTPFFVTRPIVSGAGRVGLGQRSEEAGFQISQRADYVETLVGLQTTYDRPLINTRDEPHADRDHYRRLHVIVGDANTFDVPNLLKVGTTSLVLWLLEQTEEGPIRRVAADQCHRLAQLLPADPVGVVWHVSRDLTLRAPFALDAGGQITALGVQRAYLDAVRIALDAHAQATGEAIDADTSEVLERWQGVLDGLERDPASVAADVEWVAKHQLLDRLRAREGGDWDAPRIVATDLQWHDLRPERSIVARLDGAGRVTRLVAPQDIATAEAQPPRSTRAWFRGEVIARYPNTVSSASWSSVVLDVPGRKHLVRIPMLNPHKGDAATMEPILDAHPTPESLLAALVR